MVVTLAGGFVVVRREAVATLWGAVAAAQPVWGADWLRQVLLLLQAEKCDIQQQEILSHLQKPTLLMEQGGTVTLYGDNSLHGWREQYLTSISHCGCGHWITSTKRSKKGPKNGCAPGTKCHLLLPSLNHAI